MDFLMFTPPGTISPSMPLQKEETSFTTSPLWVMCYCATDEHQTRGGKCGLDTQ